MSGNKLWLYSLGAFITGFGAATIKEGSMTEGVIIALVGLVIVFATAGAVKKH